MPYLDQDRKLALSYEGLRPETAGDLTYLLTREILNGAAVAHLETIIDWFLPQNPRFADFAIVLGALDATAREYVRRTGHIVPASLAIMPTLFYRERVAPYEDVKIKENGDVYPL